MDGLLNISEGLASHLSPIAGLFVAIIAVILLLQLLATVVTILRNIIQFHITVLKTFVLWPVWILMKLLRLVIMVLVWAVCSVARGVMALFMLFGLYGGRHLRAEIGCGDGGGGDGNFPVVSRQEANMATVQHIGMADFGGQRWRVHVLLPSRPNRGGNNMGVIVGGMDNGAGAWQATALGRNGLVAQGSSAQRSITGQGEYGRTQGRL